MRKKTSPKTPTAFIILPSVGLIIIIGLILLISNASTNNDKTPASTLSSITPQPTGNQSESMPQSVVEIGKPAPDFSLKNIDGKDIYLSDFAGKPVMINFWATWCPSCEKEMPEIEKFYENYKASGLVVLSVNATSQDNIDKVKEWIQKDQLTFPILLDESGLVTWQYQLNGLPTSYFIDRQGIIRESQVGGVNPDYLDGYFSEMNLGM